MKLTKLILPTALITTVLILIFGLVKVRQTVNQPVKKSADISLPTINEAALDSVRARSNVGRFDTDTEVSNTRNNPFEHYGGYIAPAATTNEEAGQTTDANTEATTNTNNTEATTGTTTSSTSPETESDGGKELPTLSTDLQDAGF